MTCDFQWGYRTGAVSALQGSLQREGLQLALRAKYSGKLQYL